MCFKISESFGAYIDGLMQERPNSIANGVTSILH